MRAAVLRRVGEPLELIDLDLDPPGEHQVRVRLAASGVCHSDLSVQNGSLPYPMPTVLGHEGAGVVTEVGRGVTRVSPGDHVILTWVPPCRTCTWCLAGQPSLCAKGMGEAMSAPYATLDGERVWPGLCTATFAEHTQVMERALVAIDPDVPFDIAALIGCAVSTGVGAVVNTARVAPGATVAVVGCGGVGLCTVQGARLAGASRIVAVDRVASKLELAEQAGATAVVDASAGDPVAAVRARTGGLGVDHAFEVVGLSATIKQAFAMTRRGGTVTLVGAGRADDPVIFNAMELFVDAKAILGCVYGATDPDRDFPRLIDLERAGRLELGRLITRRIPLGDVNDAFAAMAAGEVARSVIVHDG